MNPKILEMMHFRPSGHNQVSLDHIECISEFLEEFCPIDKTKAKRMLRGSMGISLRYVQEYLDSFEAWKIIKIKSGNIEYLLNDAPAINIGNGMSISKCHDAMKYKIEGMKNEDVPDTFPGDIGLDNNDPDNLFNRDMLINTVNAFVDKENMLPCRYRINNNGSGGFKPCNPEPGKTIIPNAKQCNECAQRDE